MTYTMLLGQKRCNHYVLYPDGKRSEPMDRETAQTYADLFGGTTHKINRADTRGFAGIRKVLGGLVVLLNQARERKGDP